MRLPSHVGGLSLRKSALLIAVIGLTTSFAAPAHAWDIEVGSNYSLDTTVYFSSWSAPANSPDPTLTFESQGGYANHGMGGFASTLTEQSWNGSDWPSSDLTFDDTYAGVQAYSTIDHYDTAEYYPQAFYAFVSGDAAPGAAHGSSWAFDYTVTIPAFTTATLALDSGAAYVSMASAVGDDGFGFASIKFYDPTVGIDDPNGINYPFASDSRSLSAPPSGTTIDDFMNVSHDFVNNTSDPLVFTLRVQGSVAVFENAVPEPASLALLGLGSLAVLTRRRAH